MCRVIAKDDGFFFWRTGRPLDAGWIRITRWMQVRAWLFESAAWRWGKLLAFGALLLALSGYVSIGLQPIIDVGRSSWWRIHELHGDIEGLRSGWWDFGAFWVIRGIVFALNCGWFIFWTWMFLNHPKLKAFMQNLERQCRGPQSQDESEGNAASL